MTKDITKPDTVKNAHDDDEGTGIYWFKSPNDMFEQVFIPRITRQRAKELASDFDTAGKQTLDAYRWVPDYVESAQSLVSTPCGGKCKTDLECVDNACRCIEGRCKRK
ncbi:hypothetical protein [Bradyrhizobium oligotrophicum]|uniref:hypothetical protein n=1 Tax=Bradyrhizobium oligotrophicum TaxID=44255 RepID=UPI003EB9A3D3